MISGKTSVDGPIRTVIIGAGQIVESIHLPLLRSLPKFDVRLLIDPYAATERLDALTKNTGCGWAKSMDKVSGQDFDLAVIATPVATHGDISRQLLRAGLNLFVEKPFTHQISTAEALVDEAGRLDLQVFCGQVRRFFPNVQLVRRLVAGDLIGDVKSVQCAFGALYGWDRRFFDAEANAERMINEGVLFDVGSHVVDTIAYVFEKELEEIKIASAVSADMSTQSDVRITGALSMSKQREIDVDISLSNSITLANVFWFCGTGGTLMLPAAETAQPVLYPAGERSGVRMTDTRVPTGSPFVRQMNSVADALTNDSESVIKARRVIATVGALEAAQSRMEAGACEWLQPAERAAS